MRTPSLITLGAACVILTGCGGEKAAPNSQASTASQTVVTEPAVATLTAVPFKAIESDTFLEQFGGDDIGGIETIVKELKSDEPPWRKEANRRIDRIRKADLRLVVIDAAGQPATGIPVRVRLMKHKFHFGAVISAFNFQDPKNLPKFRHPNIADDNYDLDERFRVLGQFANHVGFVNSLKYKLSGGKDNSVLTDTVIPRLRQMGMSLRGHALIWPGWSHMHKDTVALKNDPAALKARCEKEIAEYAKLWDVDEWDVVNETRGNQDVQKILGKEVLVDWFELAEKNLRNPGGLLYLNENRVVSYPTERQANHLQLFHDEAKFLLDNGAPLTALGLQSRFRALVPPLEIYRRLETLRDLKLPIKATEFEIIMDSLTAEEHARYTAEIMTIYFSHELVNGIAAWSFLGKDKNDAGKSLINSNGVKPNGKIWLHLKNKLWNTDKTLTTDANGTVSLRGFKGEYQVVVGEGSGARQSTFTLDQDHRKLQFIID